MWGATEHIALASEEPSGFNSRTPCGVRPHEARKIMGEEQVSIHAPRVGCDIIIPPHIMMRSLFQFTHPVWGATISMLSNVQMNSGFNSRTPCGVRPLVLPCALWYEMFQFTHPVWGATIS